MAGSTVEGLLVGKKAVQQLLATIFEKQGAGNHDQAAYTKLLPFQFLLDADEAKSFLECKAKCRAIAGSASSVMPMAKKAKTSSDCDPHAKTWNLFAS